MKNPTESAVREMICIACPIGCHLKVHQENEAVVVSGNKCQRGQIYATEEWFSPKRMVTTSCPIANADAATETQIGKGITRVPVRSSKPVPKELISQLLDTLHKLPIKPPLPGGSIVISNFANTGIDIITTHSI